MLTATDPSHIGFSKGLSSPWSLVCAGPQFKSDTSALVGIRLQAALDRGNIQDHRHTELVNLVKALQGAVAGLQAQQEALLQELESRPTLAPAELHDLNDREFALLMPVQVLVETYEDEIVARFPEIEAFGSGATEGEAIIQLKAEIVSLYEDLTATDWEELGRVPQGWRRVLEKLMVREGNGRT